MLSSICFCFTNFSISNIISGTLIFRFELVFLGVVTIHDAPVTFFDIDLLILLDGDKMTLKQEDEIIEPLYELEIQTGVSISPIVMLRKQWENRPFQTPFSINIANEGIVL